MLGVRGVKLNGAGLLTTGMEGVATEFESLYERYHTDVFRYALVLTRNPDDAEDIAAETFARAWSAWDRRREPSGEARPWLLAVARNIATDRWRRARRRAKRLLAASSHDGTAEVEALVWLETISRILPPRQREVIALRYHRDLSDLEVGRIMGLSESGVRSLVSRAIATLREHPEVWL